MTKYYIHPLLEESLGCFFVLLFILSSTVLSPVAVVNRFGLARSIWSIICLSSSSAFNSSWYCSSSEFLPSLLLRFLCTWVRSFGPGVGSSYCRWSSPGGSCHVDVGPLYCRGDFSLNCSLGVDDISWFCRGDFALNCSLGVDDNWYLDWSWSRCWCRKSPK